MKRVSFSENCMFSILPIGYTLLVEIKMRSAFTLAARYRQLIVPIRFVLTR